MWRWAGKALIFGKLHCFYVNLKNWDKFLEVPDLAVNRFSPTIGGGIFSFSAFCSAQAGIL